MKRIELTRDQINESSTRIGKPVYKKLQKKLMEELDYLSASGELKLDNVMDIMLTTITSFGSCFMELVAKIYEDNSGKPADMHSIIDFCAEESKKRFPVINKKMN